ncbi:hypothetical protein [Bacillus sp. B1-b2]|uniref:hypothetical protein n=1 Tax=Bacillus sp. B1-b2 TaxID=2653201 RepID=UPI0012626253|nr:hypothetical protein [Bacillus sp. B1-b2]KAB7667738.1 hypothetical protein F9279_14525 [Bacillus sp. B1-b2]
MAYDINEHYAFDAYYVKEEGLTYSNRHTWKEKWAGIAVCAFFFGVAATLIGYIFYVIFWQSLFWPVLIIGLGALLVSAIAVIVLTGFRKKYKSRSLHRTSTKWFYANH